MKRANLFLLILCCILLNQVANAALTATTTIANCNQQGSISLSSTLGTVTSFSYSGTSSGTVTGSAVNLNCGTYSVTATLNNGATETATNIIVDHEDHIQLKNWYLAGGLPSTTINWGATLNDPTMAGWTGITCFANRCVRYIYLQGKGANGAIPNLNLPSLEKIIWTGSSFTGAVPNFNLPKLIYLDIAGCGLTGTIPNFTMMPKLQILLLNNNYLSGTIPNFNFPSLINLYLDNNQLSGQIPPFNFPNLYLLYLNNNNLSGCIPSEIRYNSPNIGSNGNLTANPKLYNQNWSTYYGANSVGACMSCLAATATISVAGYKLNASTNLTSPKYLWSNGETNSSINVTNPGTYSVTATQGNGCTKSATITLSMPFSSTITNASCGSQGKIEFPSNSNIVSYAYAGTSAGAGQGKSINLAQGVYNVTLTESNGATSTISNLTIDNEEHQFLKNWYLNNEGIAWNVNWGATINDATMAGWTGITTNANGCISKVILNDLNITGSIPNFNLPSLYDLRLSNNQLSGTLPNFNLPSAAIIVLNTNQLSGTIPNFNLPNLISLTLTYNQFSGGIPKFNNNLNIESLYLGYNQLNDTIPNFNLPKLKILNLRNNQLSGSIPNFNFSPNLSNLILNNNQLNGNIPAFTAQNFDILSLEYNQLTGSIPNFNFSKIFDLRLSNNQLSGSIPNFNLPKLSNLYLGNNQLTGSIPKFNMPYLGFLYLQNNQLSGCIPIEIKYNSPLIGTTRGNISNNPSLNTQSWSNYWNNNTNTGACSAAILNGKVFLNSANTTTNLMEDYLKTLQSFPITDPYSYQPLDTVFKHVNNPIVAQVPTSTLSVTGNNAIVDWVFLELRNGTSGSTSVTYTKSALLQKDGDIVGMNGTSPVIFDNTTPGNYYITVRHRNHLGFRTANPIALSLTPTTLNFTNNSVSLYGATPLTALSPSLFAMNGGDANFDGSIDAFDTIFWELQNGLFDEYTNNADYNLDGSVDALDSILWELNNGKYQELD